MRPTSLITRLLALGLLVGLGPLGLVLLRRRRAA